LQQLWSVVSRANINLKVEFPVGLAFRNALSIALIITITAPACKVFFAASSSLGRILALFSVETARCAVRTGSSGATSVAGRCTAAVPRALRAVTAQRAVPTVDGVLRGCGL
jgi:hypothetical protein